MYVQITIVKTDANTFKVTFFTDHSVIYSENISEISEVIAMARPSLENMVPINDDIARAYRSPDAKP